jgi:putative molybdopterin biosynthesis protein
MSGLQQDQFLDVIDRDEAERRFRAALALAPLEAEAVPLGAALGRVLAEDVVAPRDVPGFDRADVDGFAVRAEDTFGAAEEQERVLTLNAERLVPGRQPAETVGPGTASSIATGAVVPRGADAIVMIEYTEVVGDVVRLRRPVAPGAHVTFAGTDIGRGETVLRRGQRLTARETGVLAALGVDPVAVVRRPRVAIVSTGDELVAPGGELRVGQIFDSNATVLADAVRELSGEPVPLGIVADDEAALLAVLRGALDSDAVLLSGGTSKGAGDVSYRAVAELGPPGVLAHGVALKPGKPLCLAATRRPEDGRVVPVVVLPGFPTSAIFTFREFVAPVLRRLAGHADEADPVVRARLPLRVNSERGRTEYLLVGLVHQATEDTENTEVKKTNSIPAPSPSSSSVPSVTSVANLVAYPMGKGSGSVTTFSRADGFVVIPRQREYLEAGDLVDVHLLSASLRPADLVVIGSHCVGLDYLLGRLEEDGVHSKFLAVGSTGGLAAARRGECDLAGVHLLDPATDVYNRPFLGDDLLLIPGYGRLQGILFRRGDTRFEGQTVEEAVHRALADPSCILVNRNRGSGTRVLVDRLLGAARPPGHLTEARSHNAVAAAVAQGRADWGVAIRTVADALGLGFLPLRQEQYDFVVPRHRWHRPAVDAFRGLLEAPATRAALSRLGFTL